MVPWRQENPNTKYFQNNLSDKKEKQTKQKVIESQNVLGWV